MCCVVQTGVDPFVEGFELDHDDKLTAAVSPMGCRIGVQVRAQVHKPLREPLGGKHFNHIAASGLFHQSRGVCTAGYDRVGERILLFESGCRLLWSRPRSGGDHAVRTRILVE